MDYQIFICKVCKEEHKRIFIGRYPNGRCKKWVDERGKEVMGLTCSSCNTERAKRIMQRTRAMKKPKGE